MKHVCFLLRHKGPTLTPDLSGTGAPSPAVAEQCGSLWGGVGENSLFVWESRPKTKPSVQIDLCNGRARISELERQAAGDLLVLLNPIGYLHMRKLKIEK